MKRLEVLEPYREKFGSCPLREAVVAAARPARLTCGRLRTLSGSDALNIVNAVGSLPEPAHVEFYG
jgi:hypothetical protein